MPRKKERDLRWLTAIAMVVLAVAALAMAVPWAYNVLTGMATSTSVDVTILGQTSGKMILGYDANILMGESQDINAEFLNTGTEPITTTIDVRIYRYVNGTIKQIAHYYDIQSLVDPGFRRSYQTVFFPPEEGLYYIRARAPFGTKVAEAWVSFNANYPYVPPEVIYVPTGPAPAPAPMPTTIPLASAVQLEYPTHVQVNKGSSEMFNISVRNVGQTMVNNVRLFVVTTSLFNFTLSPAVIPNIHVNNTRSYLVTITAPLTTPEGSYAFEFDLTSAEATSSGRTMVEVLPQSGLKEICKQVPNYEFMAAKLEDDIDAAYYDGYDITAANSSLQTAKASIASASDSCIKGAYEDANGQMDLARSSLESGELQLASSSLYVVSAPAYQSWWAVVLVAAILVFVFFILYRRRKKGEEDRRPDFLKGMESEGEGGTGGGAAGSGET